MKLKLVIHETSAELMLTAENQWEKEMLKRVEQFPDKSAAVFCEESFGQPIKGYLHLTFHNTNQ